MRRVALILLAGCVLGIAAPAALGGGDQVEVDAVFRNAGDLVEGQDVKVAGGVIGAVEKIEVENRRYARVSMKIDRRFTPFRRDARCDVKLASLIGENFVQCIPGSPDLPELRPVDGIQTVPKERTSSFVTPDVVFADLDMPQRERLRIILYELGVSLAGRGEDLGEIIRQGLPAFRNANELLSQVDRQRGELGRAIEATDRILADIEPSKGRLGEFISEAGAVTKRTARRSSEFRATIRRLPSILRRAEPALGDFEGTARKATPVIRSLRRASEPLKRLLQGIGPFADAGRPALRSLSEAARVGRPALVAAAPVAKALGPVASPLPPTLTTLNRTTDDLRDQGGVENLQRFVYYSAAITSRFDQTSHIIPAFSVASTCGSYNPTPVPAPECSATLGGETAQPAEGRDQTARGAGGGSRRRSSPATAARAPRQPLLQAPPKGDEGLRLEGLEKLLGPLLGNAKRQHPGRPAEDSPTSDLLDFLFAD